MAQQIQILSPASTLVRGTSLKVPIQVTLEQPLKVRGIRAKFSGAEETKAEYTTTSTDSKGKVTMQHHTAVELQPIVAESWILRGNEKQGFLSTMSDAVATMFGGGQHEVLLPGEYAYEVELTVPADAPPTHTGKKTRVFYELTVEVDVPLARDLTAKSSFSVEPQVNGDADVAPVRIQYPGDAGRGFFDKVFAPDVRIDLAIAADSYSVGETIEGMFRIDVDNPIQCRAIRARLIGVESSTAHGHRNSYTHVGEPVEIATPGELSGSFQQEFSLGAQAPGPLTARGKRFSIDWFVQVELDVPWAKDPSLRAPITLLPSPPNP